MKAYWYNFQDEVCGVTDEHSNTNDLRSEIVYLLQNGSWSCFGEEGDKIEVIDE